MHERTNIQLSAADRKELEAVAANRNSPQKHVWRARIVLLTTNGHGTAEIMRATGKAKTVIWRWQERFGEEGVAGLWRDKTRPSRIPPLGPEVAERIVALTLAGPPNDYKRHGVTTLFAALNVLDGKVIGQCMKRHRHQEFIRFLNVIDARVAKTRTVHVIVDNYAAHKHPKVLEWIENHPRFVFHFTPTSASWLNAVESFFAKLTKKRIKRGVFRSLQDLKDAIHRFLDDTNANPKPFTWTKDPSKIIAAVKRGHQVLDSIH
jgi:transposase